MIWNVYPIGIFLMSNWGYHALPPEKATSTIIDGKTGTTQCQKALLAHETNHVLINDMLLKYGSNIAEGIAVYAAS